MERLFLARPVDRLSFSDLRSPRLELLGVHLQTLHSQCPKLIFKLRQLQLAMVSSDDTGIPVPFESLLALNSRRTERTFDLVLAFGGLVPGFVAHRAELLNRILAFVS